MEILNVDYHTYPSEDGGQRTLLAVLTQGAVQDLTVYVGYGSPAWVAANGDKLSESIAAGFFPGLKDLPAGWQYRR